MIRHCSAFLLSLKTTFLIFLFSPGCIENKAVDVDISRFMAITNPDNWTLAERADSFFNYSVPINAKDDGQFIYVVKASCSACIANSLDCFDAYLAFKSTAPFYFLSRDNDTEVLDYYYQSLYGKPPIRFIMEDGELLTDGLYYICEQKVRAFCPWN